MGKTGPKPKARDGLAQTKTIIMRVSPAEKELLTRMASQHVDKLGVHDTSGGISTVLREFLISTADSVMTAGHVGNVEVQPKELPFGPRTKLK